MSSTRQPGRRLERIVQEAVPSDRPAWARPPRFALTLAFVAASSGVGTLACGREGAPPPATLARSRRAPTVAAQTSRPDPGFVGVVIAGDWTDLEPRVEGRIEALLVKPGEEVAEGSVVARLDVQATRYELMAARAALREARGRYQRRRQLAQKKIGVVAQEELEGIRRELLQARARVASLTRAREEATVVAPFAGSVVERYLSPGALAGPGRPVVRLATRSEPRVRFAVPEESRGRVLPDAALTIRLSQPASTLRGRVSAVSPDVDDASGMIFATAALDLAGAAGEDRGTLATGVLARVFLAASGTK
jgi:membrane fusion protein, multidrug efflux system